MTKLFRIKNRWSHHIYGYIVTETLKIILHVWNHPNYTSYLIIWIICYVIGKSFVNWWWLLQNKLTFKWNIFLIHWLYESISEFWKIEGQNIISQKMCIYKWWVKNKQLVIFTYIRSSVCTYLFHLENSMLVLTWLISSIL